MARLLQEKPQPDMRHSKFKQEQEAVRQRSLDFTRNEEVNEQLKNIVNTIAYE